MRRLYTMAEPRTQQRIAQALFKKVEVLGPLQVWVEPSEEAEAQVGMTRRIPVNVATRAVIGEV